MPAPPFGPWSTALGPELDPRLSTFWTRRMAVLPRLSSQAPGFSRRDFLQIGALGALAGLTPTVYLTAGSSDSEQAGQPPKGKGRIYLNASFGPEDPGNDASFRGIISVDPETGEYRKIGINGGSVRVSPDGETLAYSHDGAIWTNNLDGTSPGKIVEGSGKLAWMPDGQFLVVSSGTLNEEEDRKETPEKPVWTVETWRHNLLGTVRIPLPVPETDFVDDVSPDGEWFVTSSDRHPPYGSGYQLYVMRTDGADEQRLTEGRGLNVYARFSPDGREIVYSHQRRGEDSLRVVSVDGTKRRRVTTDPNAAPHACWSPDGKQLAVVMFNWDRGADGRGTRRPETADCRLVVMDADGGNQRRVPLPKATFLGAPDWR